MTIRRKARLVHAALAVLAAWPIVHIGLVWRYDVSPWKLAGWGMYTTPRFDMVGMEAYGRDAATGAWQRVTAPSPAVNATANAFLERHRWLRRLASADALAAAVKAAHPEWDALRVRVAYPRIDLNTGMVVLTHDDRELALR